MTGGIESWPVLSIPQSSSPKFGLSGLLGLSGLGAGFGPGGVAAACTCGGVSFLVDWETARVTVLVPGCVLTGAVLLVTVVGVGAGAGAGAGATALVAP